MRVQIGAGHPHAGEYGVSLEDAQNCPRPDGVWPFRRWSDAYHQAAFRADITGRRYRVHYDPANRWWNITELTKRHRVR